MSLGKLVKFIRGHIGLLNRIRAASQGTDNFIWVHSASYGEFEEVRPIIRIIRNTHPEVRILATFFSPSGYEFFKDSGIADRVFYLPLATRRNARRFLDYVQPSKVIISISDYWPAYLRELRRRRIDTYLTSARFEPSMFYFKPLGFAYRNLFRTCFRTIFVRDAVSMDLIRTIVSEDKLVLAGDPRMDNVLNLAETVWSDDFIDKWTSGKKVFVAGSVLSGDDYRVIADLVNSHPEDKFLLVPHEVDDGSIKSLCNMIRCRVVLYSRSAEVDTGNIPVMIVDTVGLLSRLYRYGFAAYIGGGFEKSGPHSVVEPAVYGIPVSFGPNTGSYYHCRFLMDCGAGTMIKDCDSLCRWYGRVMSDDGYRTESGTAARNYCLQGRGVAEFIAGRIMS